MYVCGSRVVHSRLCLIEEAPIPLGFPSMKYSLLQLADNFVFINRKQTNPISKQIRSKISTAARNDVPMQNPEEKPSSLKREFGKIVSDVYAI